MHRVLFIFRNHFKIINRTLTVLVIVFNFHFYTCSDKGEILRDGAIPVFKFHNFIQNVVQAEENNLFIAGNNEIYLLKDEYSDTLDYGYFKKAFFTEFKNQHLSPFEFKNKSLNLLAFRKTNLMPDCLLTNTTSCVPVEKIENKNRILIKITNKPPFFYIVCGTAYNGKCFLSFITNGQLILRDSFTSNRFDLIASENSNILLLIPQSVHNQGSLILAHEPDNRNKTLRPPILSKLKLDKFKNETLNQQKFSFKPINLGYQKAMINIANDLTLNNTRMRFIYGFIYERYAFILKNEQQKGKPMNTRLGRVCLEDNSFFSYTEIQLSCLNNSSKSEIYTYASAAYFGIADSYLSMKSDIKLKTNTLFVTMNIYENKIDRSKGSMLCAFNIEQIMEHFSNAIENCYSGSTNPNIALMNQYSAIEKTNADCVKVPKSDDYMCLGNNLNSYVEYKVGLMGTSLFKLDYDIITSLVATVLNFMDFDLNTFVLGSESGKIYKLARAFDKKLRLLHVFEINNQSNSINPNPTVNMNKHVYFTAGKYLIKYPMNSCAIYSTCKQCFNAVDNLKCGWCSVENQNAGGCMNEEECNILGKDENLKTIFNSENCVPIIEKFYPLSGPLDGNTLVEIKGENLCNPLRFDRNNNYKVDITIGNQYCRFENCTEDVVYCLTNEFLISSSNAIKVCTIDKGVLDYSIDGCTVSREKFNYLQPNVSSIKPTYGPIGGGTKVILEGTNLNIGRNRLVKIKAVNCVELSSNHSNLECIIQGREWKDNDNDQLKTINENGEILLEIDGNKYRLDQEDKPNIKFDFKPNPIVIKYYPKAGLRNASNKITINGTYFTSSHQLRLKTSMYSIAKGSHIQFFTKCIIINNLTLNCELPKVPNEIEINSAQSPLEALLSLVPNDDLINTTRIESNTISFYYYPLPKYDLNIIDKHIVSINSKKQSFIELTGENLSDQYEFNIKLIKLENDLSNVTILSDLKLTDKQLFCLNAELKGSNSKIKCIVDLSNESIDNLLDSIWLIQVQFEEQFLINTSLVQFELNGVVQARISVLNIFTIFIFVCLILMATCYIFYLHKNNKINFSKQKKFPHFSVSYKNGKLRDQTVMDAPFFRQSSQNGLKMQTGDKIFKSDHYKERLAEDNILIPWDCLEIVEKIGSGYFGCVYKGKLKLPTKDELTVAVKALKNSESDASQLIDEAFRMKDFKHENVLTLIGVCLKEDSIPMIILPFMKNGDLLSYIRSEKNFPTIRDLLNYAIDVGNGMKYLADLRYIHRDVAARNCMMDEKFSIKVADFGLTRDVYERNYYTSKEQKEIPIKWMALESIDKYVSTVESDVWSYGVLLWELMTRGSVPYVGLEGYNLVKFLKSGKRMPQPDSSPDAVYEIMLDCWQANPKLRPTFGKIVERIKAILNDNEEYINNYANLNVNYVNYPVEKYYSNMNKVESNSRTSMSTLPYYNSSLSIVSPLSSTYDTMNGQINHYSTLSNNNLSSNSYQMSTFSNQPVIKKIEMPNISMNDNQQNVLYNALINENIFKNDEKSKLCTSAEEKDAKLFYDIKNDNNSDSSIFNLNSKLNRQNAMDVNETDTSTYEYVMHTPQMFYNDSKMTEEINENLDDGNANKKILDNTTFNHSIKYFK